MRGRKPIPNRLKLVKGTMKSGREHPERAVGLRAVRLQAPLWLQDEEAEIFDAVADQLYAVGLSTQLDALILAQYAQAVWRYRLTVDLLRRMQQKDKGSHGIIVPTGTGSFKQNPTLAALRAEAAECARLGSELGLSPVSRIRLGVATEDGEQDDPASRFFA